MYYIFYILYIQRENSFRIYYSSCRVSLNLDLDWSMYNVCMYYYILLLCTTTTTRCIRRLTDDTATYNFFSFSENFSLFPLSVIRQLTDEFVFQGFYVRYVRRRNEIKKKRREKLTAVCLCVIGFWKRAKQQVHSPSTSNRRQGRSCCLLCTFIHLARETNRKKKECGGEQEEGQKTTKYIDLSRGNVDKAHTSSNDPF